MCNKERHSVKKPSTAKPRYSSLVAILILTSLALICMPGRRVLATHVDARGLLFGIGTNTVVELWDLATDNLVTQYYAADFYSYDCLIGVAYDPADDGLWISRLKQIPNYPAGDGFIHKIPSRGGPDISTIPAPGLPPNSVGGRSDPGIGAMDYDPDEKVLWAAAYHPVSTVPSELDIGDSLIYKLDPSSGAVLKTFSHPFLGGRPNEGNDTLAIAHPADRGREKVLLTDFAGSITNNPDNTKPTILYALDAETGAVLQTYLTSVNGITGIDEDPITGDLIAATQVAYFNLGPAPYNRAVQTPLPTYGTMVRDISLKELACDKPTITPPQSHNAGAYGWSMNVEVSNNEGVVLTDVKLNERYMAERVSVPYYNITTSNSATGGYQGRGELKPASSDANLRSRLVGYSEKTDSDKFVIEGVYSIDNIPAGSNSCLTIRQRYEFHKEGRGCEPSSTLPCSRFKPIVKYEFIGRGGDTLTSINIPQRDHFRASGYSKNTIGLFRDCDSFACAFVVGGAQGHFGFKRTKNPLFDEYESKILVNGQDANLWDNIHQTFKGFVKEPVFNGLSIKPGCPECVHSHWRWGQVTSGEGNGNIIGRFPGSRQDLDFAIVRYHSQEEHPTDYKELLNNESIRSGDPFGSARDQFHYTYPEDVVLWYSGTGHDDADTFIYYGFFFNPSYSNVSVPITSGTRGSANLAIASLSQDGPVNVTFAELYQSGSTGFTDIDPSTVAALPPGYTALNNAGYDIQTDAVVSGPHSVAFSVASVSVPSAFDNLRVFHAEEDPLDPENMIWVDRTILSPDTPAPDFANSTISSRVMELGKFVVAQLTDPQPPNTAAADLAVTSSHTPSGSIIAGNELTYALTVTNNGPQTATSVALLDGLDPNVELISISPSQGIGAEVDGSVVCTLGTLAAGANAIVTIVVKPINSIIVWPTSGDNIDNIAYVAAREIDNNFANNSVNDTVLVLPDSNAAPTVSTTTPTTGASFTDPATVALTATASDSDGTIDKVEFYDNGNLIGSGTASADTYSFTWNNAPSGSHALIAVAQDNGGKITFSKRVNITVNARFTVAVVSPANNALFPTQSNITLTATANTLDGSISQVNFFANESLLGAGTASGTGQYSFNWNNAPTGSYLLTAVATNDVGGTVTSDAVYIVVDTPPTITITSPANGTILSPPASITITASASDSDGYLRGVDFYAGNTVIGTSIAIGGGTTSGPQDFGFTWSNAPAGTYSLTAVARDNSGALTRSAPVTVVVNVPPAVSITSPTNGAAFVAPGNITLVSSASDTGGSISKVDFFANGLLIGTGTLTGANQYSLTWNNVSAGSYSLTAVATDNISTTTTSSPVSINVTTPPTVSITSPASGAIFSAPATITINANAIDSDGSISKVDFYANGSLLGTGTPAGTNQYSFTWNNVSTSAYSLTAIAMDNLGVQTTSAALSITVKSQALLVVGSTTLNSGDSAAKTRLEALNYVVTVKDASAAANTDANGKAVVVISSTISPNTLGTKFRDVAVPMVIWESGSFLNMGMISSGNSNSGTATGQTQMNVTAAHPLSAGLSGTVTVATASSSFSWGKPNANAATIASLTSDSTRQVIFGYDRGVAMPGLVAPARRIGLYFSDATAASLNTNGWALFDAAINWATSNAILSGSTTKSRPDSTVDLSAEGVMDWAHWGLGSVSGFDHKSGVTQQISNYTVIGTQPISQLTNNPVAFTWAGGTPTDASNTTSGLLADSVGSGFLITVPADTSVKTLRLYVGVYLCAGKLEATLSDGSTVAFTDSLPNNVGTTNGVYTISFRAASNGQTLTVKYTLDAFYPFTPHGWAMFTSATLFNGYPPTVDITSPPEGWIFTSSPVNITINANASDSDGTVSRVDFYAGSTFIGTDTTSPYSVTWNNVTAGNYALTAKATDNSGSVTTSTPINITVNAPVPPPAAPSNLTATAASKSQINLAWTDNATNETGFKIERSTDGSNFTQITTVGANVTSYQNTGLSRSTKYYYRVRAYNGSGDSAYSNTASATTPNN